MRPSGLALLLSCLLLSACGRKDKWEPTSYSITNKLPVAVTIDIYPSVEDYYQHTNREARHELQPQATLTLSLESFKTYGIDWYNKDYTYNNWTDPKQHPLFTLKASPLPTLSTHGYSQHVSLTVDQPDSARLILLNGNGLSSTWKAVNPDNTPHKGTHIFHLTKDFRCHYTVIDSSGQRSYDYPYFLSPSISPYFWVSVKDKNSSFQADLDFTNRPGIWTERDTLSLHFGDSPPGHFYPAVRQ